MADTEAARKKRRLRAPSETVREKAEKAQAEVIAPTPTKRSWVSRIISAPFRGLVWLSHRPPLRQIGHGLRWFFLLKPLRFIGIALGFRYFRASWQELQQVTWPSRHQSRQLTLAVIIFSAIFGGLIAGVDYGLDKLFKEVIIK